jgi:PAS domain S-box-containing protein
MEYRLRRHDGEYCWILDSGAPRFEAAGRFVGYIGSAVNVTELKRADERMRLAVEAAPNAMVMVNDLGHITLLNAQAERVFGYTRDELIGRSIDVLVPESLRSAHAGDRESYLLRPSAQAMGAGRDLYGRRKDGSEVPVEVGLNPIMSSEGRAILASIIDITARRELEAETAQQRSQLAHLSRVAMLGELSGALAHELHQPLTAILANAQAALRVLARDPADVSEVRNILADIAEDDKRASEVITGLRALLRKDEVQYLPLDINEVALTVLRLMRSDLSNRGVSVTTDLAAGLPLVEGNGVQLQQVLINLVMNGCEAMDGAPTDRHLTVRTSATLEGGVEVSVADRGSGIPPEDLNRIFEPFVTTKAEGMGLGLAVCRTIVAAHHGRLWATDNADRGATVRFALPATKTEPPRKGAS